MKASIVKIGNSRGVRLPKPIIEQCGLDDEVELLVRGDEVVIRAVRRPRYGWESAFKAMADRGDDTLIDMPDPSWDDEEWQWK